MVMRMPLLALASALLSACAAGSATLKPTNFSDIDRFAQAESLAAFDATQTIHAEDELAFWQRFDDHVLTVLVENALGANHDLRIALARWDQVSALARRDRLDRFPSVTASAGAQTTRASSDQAPGVDRRDRDSDGFDAGIALSWELDLFGRVRQQVLASRAESDAAAADVTAVQVAIVAEVASNYFTLRGLQERLRVARDNAANQTESLDLVQVRLDAGLGTEFDTARARGQLATTRARVPALEAAIAARMHRIAVLTGQAPSALMELLDADRARTVPEIAIDPGTPGDLLRRRPDILAAEYRLQAATARIGVANADLFPRFTLAGLIGSQAGDVAALFERDSETRRLALGIDWSFLDRERVRARIATAQAAAEEQLARYEQTVLLALEEAETALATWRHSHSERDQLRIAADAGTQATALARTQFDGGLVEFLAVLDAERSQFDAQDRLAQSEADAAIALVGLYRALAGGWPQQLPAVAEASLQMP